MLLCNMLRSYGYSIWFDHYDMGRESALDNSITTAIENCIVFVVCLTRAYCNKIKYGC